MTKFKRIVCHLDYLSEHGYVIAHEDVADVLEEIIILIGEYKREGNQFELIVGGMK